MSNCCNNVVGVNDNGDRSVSIGGDITIVLSGGAPGASGTAPQPETITIADGDTATIEAKRWLLGIGFAPYASARVISVGSTVNGTEYLDNEPIPANSSHGIGLGLYFHQSTVIHFSGFSGEIRLILI